jgi:protein phosphatase
MVRERNEDSFLVAEPLFVVADGMGGHLGGEVASRLTVETLERTSASLEDLVERVREANRVVFERSVSDRTVAGMGTTLTAAWVEGDRVRLVHVGDSRAYLLRGGELRQLTEDHTLVQRMVLEGRITRQEAAVHPQRNVLTRVIGTDPVVEPDDLELDLRPGDRVLLCTDGLTGMLGEEAIRDLLDSGLEPQLAAEELVREANHAGGIDNTTVIVLDVEEGDPDSDPRSIVSSVQAPPPSTAARADTSPRGIDTIRGPQTRGRPRWGRIALWTGVAVALVLAGLVGTRTYLDRQWYVGVSDGHVAVYRGIPSSVLGFDLHRVVQETSIPAAEAERFPVYQDLEQGITTRDRDSALAIVQQIRTDVASIHRSGGSP